MDAGKLNGSVFIDLKKAFDTVDHFVSWGPFLESPGNFTGPKSNIQIKI